MSCDEYAAAFPERTVKHDWSRSRHAASLASQLNGRNHDKHAESTAERHKPHRASPAGTGCSDDSCNPCIRTGHSAFCSCQSLSTARPELRPHRRNEGPSSFATSRRKRGLPKGRWAGPMCRGPRCVVDKSICAKPADAIQTVAGFQISFGNGHHFADWALRWGRRSDRDRSPRDRWSRRSGMRQIKRCVET